jgi:hypothetical protein
MKMNPRLTLAAACALALTGCGYEIIPAAPATMPQDAGRKPLALRVAVRELQTSADTPPNVVPEGPLPGDQMLTALRQSHLFRDVIRVGADANTEEYDAVVTASYHDGAGNLNIGFVFPPCLMPLVDFCIVPFSKVSMHGVGVLRASVATGDGREIKSYVENSTADCSYLPFPGLFPFNLALIVPQTKCEELAHTTPFQLGLAQFVADLIKDRAAFALAPRAAPRPAPGAGAESGAAPSSGPASTEKPWWKQ